MSTKKGDQSKKGQKHQNTYAFKHNKNSKLTKKIAETPLDLLCKRCLDILEWKIKYRKYKPLSVPGKCKICDHKNILKSYRDICDSWFMWKENSICTKCIEPITEYAKPSRISKFLKGNSNDNAFAEVLEELKERQRRTILRKLESGCKIVFNEEKGFIDKNTDEVILSLNEINEMDNEDIEEGISIEEENLNEEDYKQNELNEIINKKTEQIDEIKNSKEIEKYLDNVHALNNEVKQQNWIEKRNSIFI